MSSFDQLKFKEKIVCQPNSLVFQILKDSKIKKLNAQKKKRWEKKKGTFIRNSANRAGNKKTILDPEREDFQNKDCILFCLPTTEEPKKIEANTKTKIFFFL